MPEEYMGDVMSDFNTRRGRVLGMEQKGNRTIIRATVPQAEIMRYSTDLRSMTQGRGTSRSSLTVTSLYQCIWHRRSLLSTKEETDED